MALLKQTVYNCHTFKYLGDKLSTSDSNDKDITNGVQVDGVFSRVVRKTNCGIIKYSWRAIFIVFQARPTAVKSAL